MCVLDIMVISVRNVFLSENSLITSKKFACTPCYWLSWLISLKLVSLRHFQLFGLKNQVSVLFTHLVRLKHREYRYISLSISIGMVKYVITLR